MNALSTLISTAGHRSETVEAYRTSIERVIQHMKTHLEEPLNLEELAQIAAISKFHLVRVFDELTGTTPHHFLACLRVQRAKELLLKPDAAITDVCIEVGYTSLGTFSTTFRTLVGISPLKFHSMPKRFTVTDFALAVRRFLAARLPVPEPVLTGIVEAPAKRHGFIFVGAFNDGVPQGAPFSGTVMLKPGAFRITRPMLSEFHLMAVLIPFTARLNAMIASLPVGLVASMRLRDLPPGAPLKPRLQLRPLRATDPPILLALPPLLRQNTPGAPDSDRAET
jgi:AraC family transcriptional regulator